MSRGVITGKAGQPVQADQVVFLAGILDSEQSRKILDTVYDGVYLVDLDRRITFWNKGAEEITGFKASEVIGRFCRDNVLVHVDERGVNLCGSETCPAVKAIEQGWTGEVDVYLHHKYGHRVPIRTRLAPLEDADGNIKGAVEVFSDNYSRLETRMAIDRLERLALLDPLTGLGNRRHAEMHLRDRLDELGRYGWPFGLLFLDIDHFKRVNDSYGHDAGDKVLKVVARTASGLIRSSDMLSRWGGEEFTANIGNVDEGELGIAAEKVRRMVEQSFISIDNSSLRITVSIGGTLAKTEDTVESLVDRADRLMYRSKEGGRNQVTIG